MLRKNARNGIAVLQSALVFGLILPLIYTMGTERDTVLQQKIYLISFLVAIPVIGTAWVIRKCKALSFYLFGISVCGIVSIFLGKTIGVFYELPNNICTGLMLLIGIVTVFAGIDRYLSRMNLLDRKKKLEEKDPDWRPALRLFEYPRWTTLYYFLLLYLIGKNFNCPQFCNEVLGHTICYLFLLFLSYYLEQTEEYFFLHRHVQNFPSKRIYGISGGMLAIFCCMMLLAEMPSVATIPNRQYRDFREHVLRIDTREVEDPLLEDEKKKDKQKSDPERDAIRKIKQKKAPWWEPLLFRTIGVIVIGGAVLIIVRKIREMSIFFRESADENGDEVETLHDEKNDTERVHKRQHFFPKTEEERIRAKYRKMIRKHRKDKPKPSETPTEIEQLAQVADTQEGKALHQQYELVRYGRITKK